MLEFTDIDDGTIAISTLHIVDVMRSPNASGTSENKCIVRTTERLYFLSESYETVLESIRGDTHAQK